MYKNLTEKYHAFPVEHNRGGVGAISVGVGGISSFVEHNSSFVGYNWVGVGGISGCVGAISSFVGHHSVLEKCKMGNGGWFENAVKIEGWEKMEVSCFELLEFVR